MKTILVTGANRGIGEAIANILSEKGHRVIRAARTLPEDATEDWVQLDLLDPGSIDRMVSKVERLCGERGLDVLINNAAILLGAEMAMEELTVDCLQQTLDVNLFGTLRVSNALFPLLKLNGRAHVINMSSLAGQLSEPIHVSPAYCISKTALNGLTVQQAMAWERYGIRVNCLSPGWVKTEMGGSQAPLTIEEGADTPVWLAIEAPEHFTGKFFTERIVIDW